MSELQGNSANGKNCIQAGQHLVRGEKIISPSGVFCAILDDQGIFGVTQNLQPFPSSYLWSILPPTIMASTFKPADYITMQSDGNFCAYQDGGACVWASNTSVSSSNSSCVGLDDTAQLMVFRTSTPPSDFGNSVWTSNGRTDAVVAFNNVTMNYQTANVSPIAGPPIGGDMVSVKNPTPTQQTDSKTVASVVTETSGWTSTLGGSLSITAEGGVKIPFVAEGKISVQATVSYSYAWNGTQSISTSFSDTVNITVPGHKTYWVQLLITPMSVTCPFIATGQLIFASGATGQGAILGTYVGTNGDGSSIQYGENGSTQSTGQIHSDKTHFSRSISHS